MRTKNRVMRLKTPQLIPIDLGKASGHECPGIETDGTQYLCLIDREYHVGEFERQWYGLNFDGWRWNDVGLQFDAPGYNRSKWQAIWEIRES